MANRSCMIFFLCRLDDTFVLAGRPLFLLVAASQLCFVQKQSLYSQILCRFHSVSVRVCLSSHLPSPSDPGIIWKVYIIGSKISIHQLHWVNNSSWSWLGRKWYHNFFFWLCWVLVVAKTATTWAACGIFSCSMWDLIPWSGIKPGPSSLGAQSLNHWITKEVQMP